MSRRNRRRRSSQQPVTPPTSPAQPTAPIQPQPAQQTAPAQPQSEGFFGKLLTKKFNSSHLIFGILFLLILIPIWYLGFLMYGIIIGLVILGFIFFKDNKIIPALILFGLAALLFFLKIAGTRRDVFSIIITYYYSWFPNIQLWFFITAIVLVGLAIYNFKKGKAGIAVLIIGLGFVLWLFLPYIQDIVVPKIEATAIGGGISSTFSKIGEMIFHPEKLKESLVERSKFGPKVEEKEPMKGVKVMEFSPIYDNFLPGKPVDLRGRVHIDAIEKPTGVRAAKVSLYCEAEDKNKNIKKGLIRVDGRDDKFVDKSEIEVSQSRDYTLWCEFKDGFSVEAGKEVSTVTVKLVAVYDDFVTRTDLPISTVLAEKENEFLEDIKLQYGASREAKALCVSGCALTKLSLSTSIQPLVEDVAYNLDVRLLGASDWYGKIVKVESIELVTKPAKVILEKSCEFNEGKINEKITKYNEELKKNKDVNLVFYCDFKVNPDEELETSFFRVDAKYDYAVEARKVINIIKEKEA